MQKNKTVIIIMKLTKLILAVLVIPFMSSCNKLASDDSADFAADLISFIEYNQWGGGKYPKLS